MKQTLFLILLLDSILFAAGAVAILPFSSSDSTKNHGFDISEHLVSFMAQSGYVTFVDRANVAKIAEEIAFSQSDMVDVETAVEAGRLIGAEKIIVGSYVEQKNGIKVQARVVDVATGVVLGATIKEGSSGSEVLNQVAIALLDQFGVKTTINSGYKAKRIVGFTSLGIAAASLGGAFYCHSQFKSIEADSKTLRDDYADLEEKGTFFKTARLYGWGGSAVFAGIGIAMIATAKSAWVFEKKDAKISFAPLWNGESVGASMKVVF